MIIVENKYDFTVDELTDILENTPIKVDLDTNEAVARYIIHALNVNRIIKNHVSTEKECVKKFKAPFHIEIKRNADGTSLFKKDVRTVAFYAYDPISGNPHKGIVAEQKVTPSDIGNICELLGDVNEWGTFR